MGGYIITNQLLDRHEAFVKVEAQVFGSLRAFTPYIQSKISTNGTQEMISMITAMVDLILKVLASSSVSYPQYTINFPHI